MSGEAAAIGADFNLTVRDLGKLLEAMQESIHTTDSGARELQTAAATPAPF